MTNYKSKFHQNVAGVVATLGVFALGTVLGWSSPAIADMLHEPRGGHFANISREEQSWIGSAAMLGAFASCLVAGMSIEKLGRKRTMVFYSIPFTLGWILIGFSFNVVFMCIGRFITGFCGGVFYLCVPVYLSEISESHVLGMLMNVFQFMLVSGISFSYILGTFVSWKALALLCSFIPLTFLTLSLLIPETPHYLIAREKHYEAQKSLCWLRGTHVGDKVENELTTVQISVEESEQDSPKLRDLLRPNILKPLAISLTLMVAQQASGVNIIIFYCVEIFATSGSAYLNSSSSAILVALIQVVATLISSTFLMDKVGRRILILFSEAGMGISFLAMGSFFYVQHLNNGIAPVTLGWLPLTIVILFMVAFSIGIGPLSWTIMGEILHPKVKGLCSTIAVSVAWFVAFIVTKIYPALDNVVGKHGSFWIFSGISIMGMIIVYFILPETRGKTLEDIQLLFVPVNNNTSGSNIDKNGEIRPVLGGVDNIVLEDEPTLKY